METKISIPALKRQCEEKVWVIQDEILKYVREKGSESRKVRELKNVTETRFMDPKRGQNNAN
jgi:hypothetical protein